ncbi:hypothetical protein HDV00_008611 [Rhizophlyctis rosea]|nr:hypothetical protein HDV00_008611 [Rhizophlyctis rosea]
MDHSDHMFKLLGVSTFDHSQYRYLYTALHHASRIILHDDFPSFFSGVINKPETEPSIRDFRNTTVIVEVLAPEDFNREYSSSELAEEDISLLGWVDPRRDDVETLHRTIFININVS